MGTPYKIHIKVCMFLFKYRNKKWKDQKLFYNVCFLPTTPAVLGVCLLYLEPCAGPEPDRIWSQSGASQPPTASLSLPDSTFCSSGPGALAPDTQGET